MFEIQYDDVYVLIDAIKNISLRIKKKVVFNFTPKNLGSYFGDARCRYHQKKFQALNTLYWLDFKVQSGISFEFSLRKLSVTLW